jgi:hypothetical protein
VRQRNENPTVVDDAEHRIALERDAGDVAPNRLFGHQPGGEAHRAIVGDRRSR